MSFINSIVASVIVPNFVLKDGMCMSPAWLHSCFTGILTCLGLAEPVLLKCVMTYLVV